MEHLDPDTLAVLKGVGVILLIVITFCVGAFFIVVTIVACMKMTGLDQYTPPPSCPWCDTILRRIEVQSVNEPFPDEAQWICANTYCKECGHLFSNKEGKPEPLPRKPNPLSEI